MPLQHPKRFTASSALTSSLERRLALLFGLVQRLWHHEPIQLPVWRDRERECVCPEHGLILRRWHPHLLRVILDPLIALILGVTDPDLLRLVGTLGGCWRGLVSPAVAQWFSFEQIWV